ncbi:MAG: hypothetical protein ACFFCW_00500 [Candidatus Hodarchaeota archaeon]
MTVKNIWTFLSRGNIIVSLIAGVVFIVQVIWAVSSRLQEGIPFWLLITCSVSSLICGCFFGHWLVVRGFKMSGKLNTLGEIRYDYLPSPPTDHGWSLGFDVKTPSDLTKPPDFSAAQDAPIAGSLIIKDNGRYFMEYNVEQVLSLANIVEYCIKPKRNSCLYLKVNVSSRDKTQRKTVWLSHTVGNTPPRELNPKEWSFDVQGMILENGWILIKLSVDDEVRKSYGQKGFMYQSLCCIRIRGSLSISPITFYRIQ